MSNQESFMPKNHEYWPFLGGGPGAVWLCGLFYGALRVLFKVFPCSLSSCLVIPFSIVITSLGEERAGLCASRALFVCFVRVSFFFFFFFHFSLPLGVGGWLRFVIVALP